MDTEPINSRTETFRNKDNPVIPNKWTVLFHGTNLGRKEWGGNKEEVLHQPQMVIKTRYPGMSCITLEDKVKQAEESLRMGANYNTTRGFSTVPEGTVNRPTEIRVLFPSFHMRKKGTQETIEEYSQKYGQEKTEAILKLANKVHYELNQQHPVIPNGMVLHKLTDLNLEDGRRAIWYVPQELLELYQSEVATEPPNLP